MSLEMQGKTPLVLISGGSRGLGLGILNVLVEQGHRVVTFSRKSTEALDHLIAERPDQVFFLPADMSNAASLEGVVKHVEKEHGPIHVLINNAGIAVEGLLPVMNPADIEKVIHVNLLGTLNLTRSVTRMMLLRKSGVIVNVSSIVGIRGYRGLAAYSATKAALDAMTRSLARELGSVNIRVNSVAPGLPGNRNDGTTGRPRKRPDHPPHPPGQARQPSDVAGVVCFLLSDAAGFITGQTLVVDGGITC